MTTTKERIVRIAQNLAEDASVDDMIDILELLKDILIGEEQLRRGEGIDHDELFEELLSDESEDADHLVRKSKAKPSRAKGVPHKGGGQKNGLKLRKAAKSIG